MACLMHVFRSAPDLYQVMFSLGTMSWVRNCTHEELQHILVTPAALDDGIIRGLMDELSAHNKVTLTGVEVSEKMAVALGFEPMPSDA